MTLYRVLLSHIGLLLCGGFKRCLVVDILLLLLLMFRPGLPVSEESWCVTVTRDNRLPILNQILETLLDWTSQLWKKAVKGVTIASNNFLTNSMCCTVLCCVVLCCAMLCYAQSEYNAIVPEKPEESMANVLIVQSSSEKKPGQLTIQIVFMLQYLKK